MEVMETVPQPTIEQKALEFLSFLDDALEAKQFANKKEHDHVLRLRNTLKNGLNFTYMKTALHRYAKERFGKDWLKYIQRGADVPANGGGNGRTLPARSK